MPLHSDLKETIYMRPPEGLGNPNSHVCQLRISLYGLKQVPRGWFENFRTTVIRSRFKQSSLDHSLFFRRSSAGITLMLVYVDDILISGDDALRSRQLQQCCWSHFKMKDLGPMTYFLGLEVARSTHGIFLTQTKYTKELIDL